MLVEREPWAQRQRLYATMRKQGLPRLNKPFPGASDAHMALVDQNIRKVKPFWIGQATSGDKLCNFTSLKKDYQGMNDAAGDYFNFELTQRSEFLRKFRTVIDIALLCGRGIMKVTVDPHSIGMDGKPTYPIVFESINPMFVIMPQEADSFADADEFIHVRPMTIAAYQRLDDRWDKSASVISKIRGSGEFTGIGTAVQEKRLREGIAFTRQPSQTIIFEHWKKTNSGHMIEYYNPNAPEIDLRKPHLNPYRVNGKPSTPFFSFQTEVIDDGWYSPRGFGELLAPYEQYATKLWNEKADAITFANRPLYTGDGEIKNTANYRWQPGEYIPGNIRSVQQGAPPFSFDEEIGMVRAISEQITQAPDFGITREGDGGGEKRTATENNRIAALENSGQNDNAGLCREDLIKVYRHTWGLICQFKQRDFSYYAAGEVNELPEQALHDSYMLTPDGSVEGWNRLARLQKALGFAQGIAQIPQLAANVDFAPIAKEVIASYDARMVQTAYMPTNQKGSLEYQSRKSKAINSLLAPFNRPTFPMPRCFRAKTKQVASKRA
jgi:hypothetical protein